MSSDHDTSETFHSIHDRESLHRVRGTQNTIRELMGSLQDKVNMVANMQERDFLSAYRVHQINIQLELKELRIKVTQAQESLIEDADVHKMEEECSWFRNETSRLQIHFSSMQKDLDRMKSRLSALREQCAYLSEQLKAVIKRSRVLEAELEPTMEFASTNTNKATGNLLSMKATAVIAPQLPELNSKPNLTSSVSGALLNLTEKKKSKLDLHAKNKSIKLKKMTEALNEQVLNDLDDIRQSRTIVDEELEDSIKCLLQQIINRRKEAAMRGRGRAKNVEPGMNTLVYAPEHKDAVGICGISGLGLEHFTSRDRLDVMIHFLSKPDIFRLFVNQINSLIQ